MNLSKGQRWALMSLIAKAERGLNLPDGQKGKEVGMAR